VQRLNGQAALDTSVVVKFFFDEPDSDKADALLSRCHGGEMRLVVLDQVFIEFVNAAWLKTVRKQASAQHAQSQIEAFLLLAEELEVIPARSLLKESFRWSCRLSHASYDTALLALAESRSLPLVTADVKFYDKIRPHFPAAIMLGDLRL